MGFLIAWPCIYYWPVTLGQKVFSEGDINWLFLPIRTELSRALARGQLPLWSPGLEAGFPLFAEGEVAALYPINLALHLLLPAPSALSYAILFNFIWASIGMYLFVRSAGLRVPSALLAGFVFGFNGFATAQLSHVPHLAVASWLPWLLLFQQKYWQKSFEEKNAIPWLLLSALAIALQLLAGFPQFAFLNITTFVLVGIIAPILWEPSEASTSTNRVKVILRWLPRSLVSTAAPILLGAAIAAVQLIPTLELIGLSIRAQDMGTTFFMSYSLEPMALTQLVSPFSFLGIPDAPNMEYWTYLGVLTLCLALLAPLLRRDPKTWLFLFLALAALALAIGDNNPWYNWLYYVPVFNRFRVPARFLFYFVFATAFLAAIGFQALQDRLRDSPGASPTTGKVVALFILVGTCLIWITYTESLDFWMSAWQWLPILLVPLSLLVAIIGALRLTDRSVFCSLALGLIVVDLVSFSAPFLSQLTKMSPASDLTDVSRTVQVMDKNDPIYRIIVDKHPFTPASTRAVLDTNLPLIYGKQGVRAYLPSLGLLRNEEYIDNMTLTMRDLINIRYYLLPVEVPDYAQSLPPPFDTSEPYGGLSLDVLSQDQKIPPTPASELELVSYTDGTTSLPDGTRVGELVLTSKTGQTTTLPIRLGLETADWAYDGIGNMQHSKPQTVLSFPAYLKSVGHPFEGHKYVARYDLKQAGHAPTVTALRVHSYLPGVELNIERISLIDSAGHAVSLAKLLHRTELSLVFRSHTAAMWENLDVLPRAFMVHAAESLPDNETLSRLQQSDFNPKQVVFLDAGAQPIHASSNDSLTTSDQVSIAQYQSERVVVQAKVSSPGYLVLTDSWYPGWQAWIDGRGVPILRADLMFRAVALDAGEHTIVFEYHPISFLIGAWISVIGIFTYCVLAFWGWKQSVKTVPVSEN
jgi:hypothetical protein